MRVLKNVLALVLPSLLLLLSVIVLINVLQDDRNWLRIALAGFGVAAVFCVLIVAIYVRSKGFKKQK